MTPSVGYRRVTWHDRTPRTRSLVEYRYAGVKNCSGVYYYIMSLSSFSLVHVIVLRK